MSTAPTSLWLRCETKTFEKRAALTPTTARKLLDAGFEITVEEDPERIFDVKEYEAWPSAPRTTTIIGLKELPPNDDSPLSHSHIQFAHCYKNQAGWEHVLERFGKGGGKLYDLEFLQDESGRRVAAFGFHAGFAGAAAGAIAYAARQQQGGKGGGKSQPLDPYPNEQAMITDVKEKLGGSGKGLKALVIGALGRCGRGAIDLFRKIGLEEADIHKWDLDETAKGGPFQEILDVDIFVNCIYLSSSIPPFISPEQLSQAGTNRRLSVIVDVSCDTTNPFNPIPVYSINTTFDNPTVEVPVPENSTPLCVISIDHLPTLLPRESSEQFSNDLLPTLLKYPNRDTERTWTDAEKLFREKLGAAEAEIARQAGA
ncbi:Saccharopine dehydrogenase [Serendipita sp. 399]|nr:Saccharopine dehydrogenase [Serendipita sp. 399]